MPATEEGAPAPPPGWFYRALAAWAEPGLDLPLALFRVLLGVTLLASYLQYLADWSTFFDTAGMCPRVDWPNFRPERSLSYFIWVKDERVARALAHAALAPMVLFTLGVWPRLAALLSWYALVSLHDRCPLLLDGGDVVIRLMMLLFVYARSDRRLAPLAPLVRARAAAGDSFPIRLMQVQLCLIYLCTSLAKLVGAKWQNGTALAYALSLDSFTRADWRWLVENPYFVNAATYGTLVFELSFAFLVWFRPTRLAVLAAGVALHLGIEVLMYVPLFSWVMMASYATFLPTPLVERTLARLLRPYARWARRGSITAEVGDPQWAEILPRLDVLEAVTFRAAPGGPPLVAGGAAGARAWLRIALRVPSLLPYLPLLAVGAHRAALRPFARAARV